MLVGFAYAACLTLFVLANRLTTSANTIYLQSTAPLYLLVLGPWLLKEPIRRQDIGFMLAVALGLALFFVSAEAPRATAPDPMKGNLLALVSGFFWALTVCGLRWMGAADGEHGSPVAAVVSGNLTAFLVALPMALPLGTHAPVDWVVIVYLGVFQIAVAYVLVTSALRHIAALEASLILLIEPVLQSGLGLAGSGRAARAVGPGRRGDHSGSDDDQGLAGCADEPRGRAAGGAGGRTGAGRPMIRRGGHGRKGGGRWTP